MILVCLDEAGVAGVAVVCGSYPGDTLLYVSVPVTLLLYVDEYEVRIYLSFRFLRAL